MWTAILEALKAVWDWFFGLLGSMGQSFISSMLSLLPNSVQESITSSGSTIGFAISSANAWIPFDLFFTFLGIYAVFVLGFLGIKVLIKLIP